MALPDYPQLKEGLNVSDIYSGMWKSVPPEILDKISFVIDLGIIILIVLLVYFAVLILAKLFEFIFGSRELRKLKSISSQLDEVIDLMKGRSKKRTRKES